MTKSTITRERLEWLSQISCRDDIEDIGGDEIRELARMALAAMDSSESIELPLDYLQGHKDGLEWASQLAEANHPETGDWLYDDPIELAKAIRKGPDMPPAQPVADSEPVAWLRFQETPTDGGYWILYDYKPNCSEVEPLYRHAQPAPVVPELRVDWQENEFSAGWNACRAAMLAAAPQSPGSEPATVPGKWIPVSERMPERGDYLVTDGCDFDVQLFNGEQFIPGFVWEDKITHWMPLPAAPQGVIHG